jgi:serine/threonine protein kinase
MVSLKSVAFAGTLLCVSIHDFGQAWSSAFAPRMPGSRVSSSSSSTQLSMAVPILEEWKILKNGGVSGIVKGHPSADIDDGDTVTTSPLANPEKASARAVVATVNGSKYRLGTPFGLQTANGKTSPPNEKNKEQMAQATKKFKLNGRTIGKYALSGTPQKSTSGRSQIWTAYRMDKNGLPTGEPLAVKTSSDFERLKGEFTNYKKCAGGVFAGRFVKLIDYLPVAGTDGPFQGQSAIVVERGETNLKEYFKKSRGGLKGKALRDAASAGAQCLKAVHSSRLVWTDMKLENFVLINDDSGSGGGFEIKGIDLESVCPVRDNPIDYSPESCPPEFAKDLLAGVGVDFVLEFSYDIWSFGVMLYELSTGSSPYGNRGPSVVTKLLASPDFTVDVSSIKDDKMRDLVSQCLQTDPKKRLNIAQVLLHPYFLTTGIGPFSF